MRGPEESGPERPTIALAQYGPRIGDVEGNRALSFRMIEDAAATGSAVAILPECCLTGLIFETRDALWAIAETVDGPSVTGWRELSRQAGIYVVAGFAERLGDRLYNSAVVAAPDGRLAVYRKMHVFGLERTLFDLGDQLVCCDTPWGRIGLVICYDLWFPELTRSLAKAGASLIVSPANWFIPPRQIADAADVSPMAVNLAIAAACSNELTIAGCGRIGTEEGVEFIGGSFVIGPNGRPLAGPMARDAAGLLVSPWPDNMLVRDMVQSHLRTRRDDVYETEVSIS